MANGSVIVVGGTRAIGLELARHYVEAGTTSSSPAATREHRECRQELGGGRSLGSRFDLAEPETIAPALADVGPVRRLALVAIERDQNSVADYDLAQAIRLVTLKLVGYTEVVHQLHGRLTDDASSCCSAGWPRSGPYPGIDDRHDGQRWRGRAHAHARRGARAAPRQLDPPGHRGRQPVLGGEGGSPRALHVRDAAGPPREHVGDRGCRRVPAREHGRERGRPHRRRRLALPVGGLGRTQGSRYRSTHRWNITADLRLAAGGIGIG